MDARLALNEWRTIGRFIFSVHAELLEHPRARLMGVGRYAVGVVLLRER